MSVFSASYAQTTVTVGNPLSSTYTYQLPINNFWYYSYTQQILLSSEIGMSGDIEKIRFKYNTGSLLYNNNWTVYLGYKTGSTFTSNTDWVPIGSLTSVFTGTVTASGGWIELILSTPFTYNTALGNLVVAVDENAANYTYTSNMFPTNAGTNRAIHYYSDGVNPNPASPPTASGRLNFFNTIQLDFACATSPTISASSSSPACVGGTLNLYCTSSDPSSTFSWTGPGGFTSTDQNPVISGVTMAHAGTYTVVVTEPLGCTSTATVSVTVNPSPTIDSVTATDTEFCAGGSTTLTVYPTPPATFTYCNSNFTSATYEYITNVDYGGMSNSSGANVGGPVDYTAMTAFVTAGVASNLSVTIDPDANDYVYAWIDWNQDGDFTDPGETYTLATNTGLAGPHILSITPPMTANNGNTRMRVMVDWNNATPNSCRSATFGEAEDYTVNVTGGTDPFTYSWFDGVSVVGTTSSITVSPTDTTAYVVTVTNAIGCSRQDTVNISVNQQGAVSTDPTGATVCEGQPITLTGAGTGTGFQWLKDGSVIAGETNDTLTIAMSTMADAGSYQLIAVGAGGCNDTSAAATVTVNAAAAITTDPTGVSVCEGQAINLSGAGTGTGYQWLKDGAVLAGETSATLSIAVSVLADAGNYQLISTNASGCNDTSAGAAVSVTAYPVIDSISASDKEICNGASVDLAVVMAGGTGAAAYCNSNFTSTSFEHITNVDYAGISNASAGNTGGPVDYTAMTANVTAGVSSDLSVTIIADAFEYVYAWIDWNQDNDFADAGETYTLATNTSSDGPHILSITPPMTAYNGNTRMRVMVDYNNATPNPCRSAVFGEAEDYTVNVTGGMTPPTYSWSDGMSVVGTTSNITVTPTATTLYTVTVTNGPGCSSQDTVTITVNSVGVVTTDPTGTIVCEGQPISLSGAGTGSGYQWLKDGAALVGETASTLSIAAATAANAGSYQLIVLGSGGCNDTSAAAVVSVNANPVIDSISASATEICNGASVNLSVALPSPILTYCNSNFTNATYDFITNVDYGGMSNTSAGTIGGPVDYTAMTANVTAGVAGNLSVTIDPDVGDYVYAWIDWNQNGSFADAGEAYTLATNTSSAGPHILSITPPMTAYNGNTRMRVMVDWDNATPNSCRSAFYGEAEDYTVNVTGGADPNTYSWSDGMSVVGTTNSITVSPTDTTTYTVTVTNANGCDAQDSVEIIVNPPAVVTTDPTGATVCEGQPLTLTGAGTGTGFQWLKDGAVIAGETNDTLTIAMSTLADAGSYQLIAVGAGGCNDTSVAATVTVNAMASITTDPTGVSVCEGQPISLSGAGTGTGYQWLKDGAVLAGETSATLSIAAAVLADAGNYQLISTNASGCNDTSAGAAVSVTAYPVIDSISASDKEICNGASVDLAVVMAGGTGSAAYCNSNFTNATYEHITNVDYGGMSNTSAGNTGGPVDYTAMTANVTAGVSSDLSVTILPDAYDYVYAWIDWNQDNDFADAGETYTLATATSSAGPHILSITPPMTALNGNTRMRVMVDWAGSIPDPCRSASFGEAEDYTVNVTGGMTPPTYSWSDGMSVVGTTSNITVTPTATTLYTVTVTNGPGCSTQDTVTITVNSVGVVTTDPTGTTVCEGQPISLSGSGTGSGYQWLKDGAELVGETASTLSIAAATAANAGSYQLIVLGGGGCNDTSTAAVVSVNANPVIDSISASATEICNGDSVNLSVVLPSSPLTYCNSNFTSATYEYITNVDYGGIINSSGSNTGGPVNYTSMVANVTAGVAGNLSVTIDPDASDYVYAWIDWNQNGDFTDPGETYTLATNTSLAGPHILSITPPMTANNGNTRMRVMVDWNNATPNSCRSTIWGEAEDYTVNVTGGADPNTYSWSDGMSVVGTTNSITVSPTDTTTYTVTVTNANGCDAQDSVEIAVKPRPDISATPSDNTDCHTANGSISITSPDFVDGQSYEVFYNSASAGIFTVASGSIDISGLDAGTYTDLYLGSVSGCNSDTIASVVVGGISSASDTLATSTSNEGFNQGAGVTRDYRNATCELIATINSTGGALGNVVTEVVVESTAGMVNGMPYASRHYEITADNATTPATVTLYLTPDEVTDYNANNDTFPDLDLTLSNIKVTAYHNLPGTGGAGPNGHALSNTELITSVSAYFNAAENRWELTFVTSGFSGFYFHTTSNNTPLNISMGPLSGKRDGNMNVLSWNSLDESNASHFEVERSQDGRSYTQIGQVKAKGNPGAYTYQDADFMQGNNFYKVAFVDVNGKKVYSNIVKLVVSNKFTLSAFPNPTTNDVTLSLEGELGANPRVFVTDLSGRIVYQTTTITGSELIIPMKALAPGVYVIKYTDDIQNAVIKVSKTN